MTTPMRSQYLALKKQYPDIILFFRLGDFYETFDEDAKIVASVCDVVLTSRPVGADERVPLAGVPYHAVDTYIAKLINAGYKVAIAEQIGNEPPKGEKLVPRVVRRVVTPGTLVEPGLLPEKRNNYVAAVVVETPRPTSLPRGAAPVEASRPTSLPTGAAPVEASRPTSLSTGAAPVETLHATSLQTRRAGLAYADISTGEFAATEITDGEDVLRRLTEELARLAPAELLYPAKDPRWAQRSGGAEEQGSRGAGAQHAVRGTPHESDTLPPEIAQSYHLTPYAAWRFEETTARQALLEHFRAASLAGFGCDDKPLAVRAAGGLLQYLQETQQGNVGQIAGLRTYSISEYMLLDEATRRNLELTESIRGGTAQGSLLGVLDATLTPMGGRLLRKWLNQPLLDITAINARLDAVEAWYCDAPARAELRQLLRGFGDLERWVNRCVQGIALPRELVGMREALARIQKLEAGGWGLEAGGQKLGAEGRQPAISLTLPDCADIAELLAAAIADEPPATLATPGVIRPGYSAELDGIHTAIRDAKAWIANLEPAERQRTGIKSLKVGYNKVFGYYIEVTTANAALVPPHYIRKQTLVNAERYITPELKEYESLVLNAEERILELEGQLYRQVLARIAAAAPRLLTAARAIAELDVAAALAEVAEANRYVRPVLAEDRVIDIKGGRHPVVEKFLAGEPFTPNDVYLSPEQAIVILTGPNMSGKCVRGDTLVFTGDGLVPIGSLQPGEMAVDTFSPVQHIVKGLDGYGQATHFYAGGRSKTIRIRTRLGYELEGTPEHRVWVRCASGDEGWKPLAEIQPGDYVAIDRRIDLWGSREEINTPRAAGLKAKHSLKRYPLPTRLTPDLAYVMGLLVGDGTLRERNAVALTTADESIAQEFRRIVYEQFGYEVANSVKFRYSISSRQIRLFFEELGLDYVTAIEKSIPSVILTAPKPIVRAFLQGLFDTDGYVNVRGNVSLSTSSERLAHQVHILLLNFGIISSLQTKKGVRSVHPNYLVTIYGAEALTFYREIGFRLPRKQAGVERVSTLRMPNVGGIPHLEPALKQVQARIVATPGKAVALKHDKSINSIFYTYLPSKRNISYFKLDELVAYCQNNGVAYPELSTLIGRRYFYDPVVEVAPGEAEVFDLSVEATHSFVANGFVSHNSTYLRQVAHIVLMAQIGSFVPAESAHIGVVDRIFTRIGASDEIARGQSTFMVEMVETANILHHATNRSLLILDEIGRGTSTYDGLAIAWAVVEYIHNHPGLRARTLFATHYHELTDLAERLPHVVNFNVAVAEQGDKVVFLHKIVPGPADRSYGVHVAQLAGLPKPVIARAQEILADLEASGAAGPRRSVIDRPVLYQLPLFSAEDPVIAELRALDINSLSPLAALNKLYELQKRVRE